jgi:hypothetical protein
MWFYFATDYETILPQEREERPIREKKIANAEEVTVAICSSPAGIQMIAKLPKGERFNSQYFGQNVFSGFSANLIGRDNASPHQSRVTLTSIKDFNFHPVPHPSFSPDLAPSEFYLSVQLKEG